MKPLIGKPFICKNRPRFFTRMLYVLNKKCNLPRFSAL